MSGINIHDEYTSSPTMGVISANNANVSTELRFNVNQFFSEYNKSAVPINSFYPILQKRLAGGLKNISIEGNMMTTYTGVVGSSATHGYSLIQVGKSSSEIANALGGYGIAWKPLAGESADATEYSVTSIKKVGTGQYEITLKSPYPVSPQVGFPQAVGYLQIPYRSTSTFVFVSIQFTDYLEDGSTVRCLSGNTELIDGLTSYDNVAIYLVKPNVYIVDYTSSINDINLWDNLSDEMGFLSFLNCGVASILPNTDYKFTLSITEDGGLTFSIEAPAFTISAPARIPMYEYVAANDTDSIGISVYGTDNFKWYYDNIRIASMAEQYPYLYCVFSPEGMRNNIYIKAIARGYKIDTADTGIRMYACNRLGEWDLIGYNTGDAIDLISSDVIARDEYIFRGAINVILIGTHPGDYEGNSAIEIDNVSLENSESISTHIGGFADVYIDAPCTEVILDVEVNAETGSAYIDNSTTGIVHIIDIQKDGITLSPNIDYNLGLDEYSYTCRGSITIMTRYPSGTLTVKALVCQGLVSIHRSLTTKSISPINYDMLVKHRIVHYLDVLGANRTTVLPYLSSYIEALPRVDGVMQFDYAQFIFYLLQNNITTSRLIIVDSHMSEGNIVKAYMRQTSDSVYLNKISCFRVSSGQ